MAKFSYKIKDASGQLKEGVLQGKDRYSVAKELGPEKRVVVILSDTGERYFSMEQYFEA